MRKTVTLNLWAKTLQSICLKIKENPSCTSWMEVSLPAASLPVWDWSLSFVRLAFDSFLTLYLDQFKAHHLSILTHVVSSSVSDMDIILCRFHQTAVLVFHFAISSSLIP